MNRFLITFNLSGEVFRLFAGVFQTSTFAIALCSSLIPNAGYAQTTESLTIQEAAAGSPDWIVEMAEADDFREPIESAPVPSRPYSKAVADQLLLSGPAYQQPSGALTGKVMFAMAGHGWTYNSEEMYYYTQRGLSHGMVEDMGNADQMHIFAHMAFNAGATIVPFRPIDYQPNERILDNSMPQVELFGDWRKGDSDRFYGARTDAVPYAVAKATLSETAIARYRPYIPESGYYPVYVWARDGDDRSKQLYRIVHSGGHAEIRVNWRQVGKTWVWLGTYYFNKGDTGYVETTNKVLDPYEAYNGNVVVADAVRFGNGKGDVPRPGGISGFLREDEGDSYWIERALGANTDRRIFDTGKDGNSTISSPPKAAAHVNRETEGSFFDRILISFHSNASTGKARGAIALFNASAGQRPTYQESLAEIIGQEINIQMKAEQTPGDAKWSDRERNTYSGINFGELRRDYIQNEMNATIVETAFHDNAEDVEFLLNPISRIHMAQATLRGVLKWYSEVASPGSAVTMPPARPVAIAALIDDGKINVKWRGGTESEFSGDPAREFRVYRSPDGYGFDGGVAAGATVEGLTVDPLTSGGVTFIRVTALNAGGESFPSQTIAVGLPGKKGSSKKSIIVPVHTSLDKSTNIPYNLGIQPGGPYKATAQTERVRALYAMEEPSGAAEAFALVAAGQAFDGADSAAFEDGLVDWKSYKQLFVTSETQNPEKPILSEKIQNQLRSFLNRSGKLYLSGSGLAANLYQEGGRNRSFLSDVLGVSKADSGVANSAIASTDDRFFPTSVSLSLAVRPNFWQKADTTPSRLELRQGRSIELMKYSSGVSAGSAATLTRPTSSEGEVILLGFPLSLIPDSFQRTNLMKAVLKQM